MDLSELRSQIDNIDSDILRLFSERMKVCEMVADYKRKNNLPVFQKGREKELLEGIRRNASEEYADGAQVIFSNIMDVSKCIQQNRNIDTSRTYEGEELDRDYRGVIACQGIEGAYSEAACRKLFNAPEIEFFPHFEDVFRAVSEGKVKYGIIPIQNSTAGSVSETYSLMGKYNFSIAAMVRLEINHCLAAREGVAQESITKVYSHAQALSQCSRFLKECGFEQVPYDNTAMAAEFVKNSDEPVAAVCSAECAEKHGLVVLSDRIADVYPNCTRFICISGDFCSTRDADTVSVLVGIPDEKNSLYRLLTKFSVSGVNLSHIESRIIPGGNFEAVFYLDFDGNVSDRGIRTLLAQLEDEAAYFRFIGNYKEFL